MANKNVFRSWMGRLLPKADAVNSEQAPAYAFPAKHALAQYAATGCLNSTFYASAKEQLDAVLTLASTVDFEFVAKTAVYAREKGAMKDLPAFLSAALAVLDGALLERVFPRVMNNGKMVRNFVQILRSGVVGRKSLGSRPKRLVRQWMDGRTDEQLFHESVGNDPSLADLVKMVHPAPKTAQRKALYGYLIGREHDATALPARVTEFEAFKKGESARVPEVPFQMLTALTLSQEDWIGIAKKASWTMTRMNLNTFARHGVFKRKTMTALIADRLRDREQIEKAKAFPYQLMAAFLAADENVPKDIREALQDAMEFAIRNVPEIRGQVYVCPDVSGSMQSPVTGVRKGATTSVRCVDVAALVAASVLRRNPSAEVLPFEKDVVRLTINGRDSVMTNARKLASVGGGGTACSAPLAKLNREGAEGDLVILVSDNESWMDAGGRGTALLREWESFKSRNPGARLVCLDLQPNKTTQALERADILNIGGFSDAVFEVISEFAEGRLNSDHWVGKIEEVTL
jgi:60 kDa SS-A/Ro ribonucleoprotein